MEEKTNKELLTDFAKATNRVIDYKEVQHQLPAYGVHRFPKFRYTINIPNNSDETSYFVWFSDPFYKIAEYTVFCGAFIPLPSQIDAKIKIRSKNIFDKLNPFAKNNHTLGSRLFDSKAIISSENLTTIPPVLNNTMVQHKIIQALDIYEILQISINEYDVDFVEGLKGKSYLSIVNPQSWYMEKDEIENLFNAVEEIRKAIEGGY